MADDLSHIVQQPGESARKFWTRFLTKKNQIVDCPDAEALAAFKHSIRDEWLARHLGQEKPKSMAALTTLMTRFCAGEDSWLAHIKNTASEYSTALAYYPSFFFLYIIFSNSTRTLWYVSICQVWQPSRHS